MFESFDDITLKKLADFIGSNLSHREVSQHFETAEISEVNRNEPRSMRIFEALRARQRQDRCGNSVMRFIFGFITPKRYSDEAIFEAHRSAINESLAYFGIEINKRGEAMKVSKATTITEAKERSKKIKERVHGIGVHFEIVRFCEEEWLKENYFHAILEITKSVGNRLRGLSGYITDGAPLIDECFALGTSKQPMLAFNSLRSESEESEHKGFSNFCKGFYGMYRNPKAHSPKILEDTQLTEMTEVLVIASIIHRKLDKTVKTGYK